MSFKPTLRAAALAAATLLSAGLSQAAVVTYYFEDAAGRDGEFSFDDANVTTIADPFGAGGTAYAAISFSFDGVNYANPILDIFDNYQNGSEYAYFIDSANPFNNNVYLTSIGHSLFSSGAASQMAGRQLADFGGGNWAGMGGITESLTYFSTTPQAAPVPEPEGYALMLAGLAAVGAAARRRAAKR